MGHRSWALFGSFMVAAVAIAVVGGGGSQPISFYRLTTFSYGPTLCATLAVFATALPEKWLPVHTRAGKLALLFLVAGVWGLVAVVVWRQELTRTIVASAPTVVGNAVKFASGNYSLRQAYENQQGMPGRLPWGGVYPGIAKAASVAGSGTPIWSFHVHSYCMIPDCNVRTHMSFRFSKSWPLVYYGAPQEARAALQREGLNYFFYSNELPVTDPLPTAPLFSPEHIAQYLAVAWSDGMSFLLTWPGPKTSPIAEGFLQGYKWNAVANNPEISVRLGTKEWRDLAYHVRAKGSELRPFALPWGGAGEPLLAAPAEQADREPRPGMMVISATYGGTCGVAKGNVTGRLAAACSGLMSCTYVVDHVQIGDPAPGCGKDFAVDYECPGLRKLTAVLPAEAGLKGIATLTCEGDPPVDVRATEKAVAPREGSIRILSATYGGNCGAVTGNVTTRVAAACDGVTSCKYVVDHSRIGDPAPGCGKDFSVDYECRGGSRSTSKLPPEAGFGSIAELRCQ
jgi:hypothetical protein